MKKIRIASLWNANIDLENSVIINLIKILSKKSIEFVSIANCDILIFGPYEQQSFFSSIKRRALNSIKRRVDKIDTVLPNIDFYLLNRKIKPIKIYHSYENNNIPNIKYDFAITTHLGIEEQNHLRFPVWKETIDWSHLGIYREIGLSAKRFGSYLKIKDLMNANENNFFNKDKKICLFASHLNEPRNSMYKKLSEHFEVSGYGPYFNKNIKHHNLSQFNKREIMKNYGFNLCPENSLCPGFYSEKIPEAFLGNCLPISWADKNINYDFNENAFINLIDYMQDNYDEICNLLKEEDFLKKFNGQPLLIKEPNLEKETLIIKRILDSL
jgi:hypothetical protein